MALTTTRRLLPYPQLSDAADIDTAVRPLAQALDNVAFDDQGTVVPAAIDGKKGDYFYHTTTSIIYRHNGTSWIALTPQDAASGTPSLRTLGSGSTQAAAGDDPRLHKTAVRGVAHFNIGLSGPAGLDGIVFATGDRILLVAQTTANQNGVWVVNTAGAWARATDADTTGELFTGVMYYSAEGSFFGRTYWRLETLGTIIIGTTAQVWKNLGWLPVVTSFPASPLDGQELILSDLTSMLGNSQAWHMKYVAAAPGANKWMFIGGPSLMHKINASESTASAAYTNLATTGPDVVIPRTGIYNVQFGSGILFTTGESAQIGVGVGNFAAHLSGLVEVNEFGGLTGANSTSISNAGFDVALTIGDTLRMRYLANAGGPSFRRRWLIATPKALQ